MPIGLYGIVVADFSCQWVHRRGETSLEYKADR
jgi:hypothetical protein